MAARTRSTRITRKVALVGDGNVGKTSFVTYMRTKQRPSGRYVATLGVEAHPLHLKLGGRDVVCNMWDCAGQEKFGGLRDGYYIQSHGAIVMFTYNDLESLEHVTSKWIPDVRRVCGDIPIVVVGTRSMYEGMMFTEGEAGEHLEGVDNISLFSLDLEEGDPSEISRCMGWLVSKMEG